MDFKKVTDCYTLSNGVKIPCVGYGTFKMANGADTAEAIVAAIAAGFHHVDTAQTYGNEKSVGAALKKCGVPREEIFVTSKLGNNDHGYEATRKAFANTLKNLGTDYLDLYLVHWPNPLASRDNWVGANAGTWKAMEEFYEDGKIRAIGVSNFFPRHFERLFDTARIMPMVNQISLSPGLTQDEVVKYSRDHGMLLEAYSPLGQGGALNVPEMLEIAKKYGKSAAQICVRWSLQMGFLPLPKSTHPERIAQNMDVFDFELSSEDVAKICALNCGAVARDPDQVAF